MSRIWWYALGYFLCYVPFGALTKAASEGLVTDGERISGLSLLPGNAIASMLVMISFLTISGWWRAADQVRVGRFSIPVPGRDTLLSGLCVAFITTTTMLAYAIEGVSVLFMMLLMRGTVLILAPIVDILSGRKPRTAAYWALGLSLIGVLLPIVDAKSFNLPFWAAVDLTVYVAAYFLRFRLMSKTGKSDSPDAGRRYLVGEQITCSISVLLATILLAVIGIPGTSAAVADGFSMLLVPMLGGIALLIGALSQGTGTFGSLVLLDGREHTYCVPVNRASSVLAGVAATSLLAIVVDTDWPSMDELIGSTLVIIAIVLLARAR
jgi:hypothetical protein